MVQIELGCVQPPLTRSFSLSHLLAPPPPLDHPGERENDVAVIDTGLTLAQAEARLF